jgi:hypothetical protein
LPVRSYRRSRHRPCSSSAGPDREVLELNRQALELLGTEKRLEIVEGATHLFEEPGALDRVADLARDWFVAHLAAGAAARSGAGG